MVKKINISVVKEFMFHHGEKVALGTCVFLALMFGVLGLLRAMGAGKADGSSGTWAEEFKKHRDRLRSESDRAELPVFNEDVKGRLDPEKIRIAWGPIESHHVQSPYNSFPREDELKRINPVALGIKRRELLGLDPATKKELWAEHTKLQYVPGLVWVHEVEGNSLKGLDYVTGAGVGPMGVGVLPKNPMGVGAPGVAALPAPVLKKAVPVRMVVVTAVFPMKKQMEEFQRALKMLTQAEMFLPPRDDLPRPLGISVVRFEMVNGQPTDKNGTPILLYDSKTQKVGSKQPKLDELLRTAIYDEQTPELLEAWIYEGLVTPMPKLASARYPKFDLPGFEIAWDDDEKGPNVAGVGPMTPKIGPGVVLPFGGKKNPPLPGIPNMADGGVERKVIDIKAAEVKKADLPLFTRLFDKAKNYDYNIYHALGQHAPPKLVVDAKGGFIPPPPMGGAGNQQVGRYFSAWDVPLPIAPVDGADGPMPKKGPLPMPIGPQPGIPGALGANVGPWDRDALVRFIDPDVVPGKTYQYAIKVHLANPNFGKKALVAFDRLADVRELTATGDKEWEYTPSITIPQESFLFAVDQHLLDEIAAEKAPEKKALPKGNPFKLDKDETTFQIHQWTERTPDKKNNTLWIGDWTIAERVVVKRGESIGFQALVKVPVWFKDKDAFEVPHDVLVKDPKKPKDSGTVKQGILMDFKGDGKRPILVDFIGGKRFNGAILQDEAAVEALILSPDGKLTVLNSRIDSDPAFEAAKDRHDRVTSVRRRVEDVLSRAAGVVDPKNPMDPMKIKLPGAK